MLRTDHVIVSALLLCVLALAGCSSARPAWVNGAVDRLPAASPYRLTAQQDHRSDRDALTLVLSFSGGGTRAAAFASGILEELAATRVRWQGRDVSLADEVDVVSGVSGGSVVAAHFVAFGSGGVQRFRDDFLYQNVEGQLIRMSLRPDQAWRLSSPWIGVSQLLVQRFDALYQGLTYRDLMRRNDRPLLVINATDLDSGNEFAFTQDQFDLLCSDLGEVPLSFAVAASSAVPLLFTPLSLRNHHARCHPEAPTPAPYLHLVDGGLADNLGLRPLLALAPAGERNPSRVEQVILISVDAARDPAHGVNASDRVPTLWQVIDAMAYNATEGKSRETRRWLSEVVAGLQDGTSVHLVSISLNDLPDPYERTWLRRVPTAFSLPREDVDRIIAAGRMALREHPAFLRALRSLDRSGLPQRPVASQP